MTTDNLDPGMEPTEEGAIDRLRDSPVGTNDPNIVGDVGPTDVPPGTDPPARQPMEDPPAEEAPSLDAMEGPTTYGQPVDPAT